MVDKERAVKEELSYLGVPEETIDKAQALNAKIIDLLNKEALEHGANTGIQLLALTTLVSELTGTIVKNTEASALESVPEARSILSLLYAQKEWAYTVMKHLPGHTSYLLDAAAVYVANRTIDLIIESERVTQELIKEN